MPPLQIFLLPVLLLATARSSHPQDQPQPNQSTYPLTTVHGVVRIGVSGEPLPRALVRISGDAATGVLTDGDGRFEIADVPEGPLDFTVIKPGFLDETEARADSISWSAHGYGHNVIVVPGMGDVVFTMEPVNAIRGQVQLSTGDAAQGIQVTLLKRTVQDGRVVWQNAGGTKTNSEGVYRFGELSDGQYVVYTEPQMDSDTGANMVANGSGNHVVREGYPSVFYPDAHDPASAARIRVAGGEQAQANISLTLEPFHTVSATLTIPRALSGPGENVSVQVLDTQGNQLPYTAQYEAGTHTAQAFLPDGAYILLATATSTLMHIMSVRDGGTGLASVTPGCPGCSPVLGEVTFAVAGRALSNLRLPLSPAGSSPIQVAVQRGQGGSGALDEPRVYVTLSQVGGLSQGMVSSYAEGTAPGPLETTPPIPGSYWVHTSIASKSTCEASFTAGGASLAREPLVLGIAGTTAPLVLTLRDDCASLTLSLPGSVGMAAGEERSYTVYVVPDFESTEDVVPQTLRLSTGGSITLRGLTPGSYHVYTFSRPVALEYRNPAVLAALPGQAVSLAPNAEADLTVEVPQP